MVDEAVQPFHVRPHPRLAGVAQELDPAAQDVRRRVPLQAVRLPGEPYGGRHVIGIHAGQERGPCGLEGEVERLGQAARRRVQDAQP